ncbi:MAG: ferric reductase-like transmembrane domain-containing protein [Actinomycetota bacterium]|nr:ferric reductase-like transmembrane domain-containing protein [Actinomycetota bacterium]
MTTTAEPPHPHTPWAVPAASTPPPARHRLHVVPPWWRDATGALTWLSVLVVVALWVHGGGLHDLTGVAAGLTSLGRVTGLVASDLLLLQVLLMARLPWVEQSYGQDELARRHRLVGFWSFNLMLVHVALITLGYAATARVGVLSEAWSLVVTYPGMLLSLAGSLLLVLVTTTSIRRARRRLRYESWHLLHLYAYLGVGLALPHQLWAGQEFLTSRAATTYWWSLWLAAAGAVLVWRVAVPVHRTLTHDLRVVAVTREGRDAVSVTMEGRRLHRLPVSAGQFFVWRFLDGAGWSRGHPYSLSAAPAGDTLRITVKDLGDGSSSLRRVRVGTRVAIEGPYGRLHAGVRTRPGVLLLASGMGVTPLRGLLEALPQDPGDVTLVYRARNAASLVLKKEIEALAAERGARVIYVLGRRIDGRRSWLPRSAASLSDVEALRDLVPDVALRDVYLCGSGEWMDAAHDAALGAGVPERAIHQERFTW